MLSCAPRQQRARDAVDQQRDQDRRKRQLHVGHPHDERVGLAADVAREQAERRRRAPSRTAPSADADQQRDARAEQDRRQHVAPLVVGAERERPVAARQPRRRLQRVRQVDLRQVERVVRRDPRREHRRCRRTAGIRRPRRSRTANAGSCTRGRCPRRRGARSSATAISSPGSRGHRAACPAGRCAGAGRRRSRAGRRSG